MEAWDVVVTLHKINYQPGGCSSFIEMSRSGVRLKPGRTAERLGLSVRQIERLCRRYEATGPAGLVSARRGRPSNRELSVDLRAPAMALVRERSATPISARRWPATSCGSVRLTTSPRTSPAVPRSAPR